MSLTLIQIIIHIYNCAKGHQVVIILKFSNDDDDDDNNNVSYMIMIIIIIMSLMLAVTLNIKKVSDIII